MNTLFDNVFYKKKDHHVLDEIINVSYWVILLTKNVLKWVLAASLLSQYDLIYILPILPVLKFFTIGVMNLMTFRKRFRGCALAVVLTIIILIESIFELPMNYMCPIDRVYMHTNYYHIYDTGRRKYFQIICELCENLTILVFIFIAIGDGVFGLIGILALSFTLTIFVYYVMALFYFLVLFKGLNNRKEEEKKMVQNRMYVRASVNQEMVSSMKEYPHIVRSYDNEIIGNPIESRNYMNTSSSL
jgi:hypothetical protein